MRRGTEQATKWAYRSAAAMLILALLFPIGLMIGNPTLMFERGWEQFVGTGIYLWACVTLGLELLWLRRNELAFEDAPGWLAAASPGKAVDPDDQRLLPTRLRQLAVHSESASAKPTMDQLIQINQEASGLDQEQAAGRFTLTRYILYLLPVIGFIGTVEGISKALMNISRVLPMVKELDGFLSNLTSVTSALQIAFDSTLLALFLSAALMLVQTLVHRRSEELLARVDRWIVEQILPRLGGIETVHSGLHLEVAAVLGPYFDRLEKSLVEKAEETRTSLQSLADKLGDAQALGEHVDRFSAAVDPLPGVFSSFQRGADAFSRMGDELRDLAQAGESARRGAASLARIESALAQAAEPDHQLVDIQRGIDRACGAIESLSTAWTQSLEKSSRATQEQLARTLSSLKDALDLLQVSIEQGNSLYRNIVKKMFDDRGRDHDGARAA